ncbi:MAG: phytanoyl-CoA dioxygenase family protein [Hyphomicrobiaceae bacterium]
MLLERRYVGWHSQGLVKPATDTMTSWDKPDRCYKAGFDWHQPFDISLPQADIRKDTLFHFGPAVFDLVTHHNVLDCVESLIGPEITMNPIQHVRIKLPESAVPKAENRAHLIATDWHQDKGVTLEEADETEFVTVWLAITDTTIENGCLQVAPGPQATLLPHCTESQVGIADAFLPRGKATPAPGHTPVYCSAPVVVRRSLLRLESDHLKWIQFCFASGGLSNPPSS